MNKPMNKRKSPLTAIGILALCLLTGASLVSCASLYNKSQAQQEKIEELDSYAQKAAAANKRLADSNANLKDQVAGVDIRTKELKTVADAALKKQTDTQEKLDRILESLTSVEENIRQIRVSNTP